MLLEGTECDRTQPVLHRYVSCLIQMPAPGCLIILPSKRSASSYNAGVNNQYFADDCSHCCASSLSRLQAGCNKQ